MRRGLVLNLIGNVTFFVCGYAIHFFVGGYASAAGYGVVGTIITVLDFEYLFTSNGARQSLARNLASRRYDVRDTIVKALVVQAAVIALFFIVDFAGAPLLAGALNDDDLTGYFRMAAFLLPANGLYIIMLGINEGLQHFGRSASLYTFYSLIKLGTIPLILVAFPHDPAMGVEVGYLSSMIVTIAVGGVMFLTLSRSSAGGTGGGGASGETRATRRIAWREVVRDTFSFSLFFIMASLILSADTLVVKALVTPASMTGYYTGAVNFGKTTYYLLQAFAVVILPVVSRLLAAGAASRAKAVGKARDLVLVAFAFVLPIAVTISATAEGLLSAFYRDDFAVAAPALSCLALSGFFMGMTVVFNMILNAEKDTHFSDVLSITSLIVVLPVFAAAARFGGITVVAASSMICTFVTMTISYLRLRARFADVMTARAWVVVAVNAAVWAALHIADQTVHIRYFALLALCYAVLYAAYLAVLFATRLIDRTFIHSLKDAG
ncbi:MATE family efflux transporter [Bifidobacterium jacchi]|uniref:Polysaccharide biosynthesis protein n=1 Tax=Bifidobacterium jacchi TaxID=2490545 RepID=A0A5N5RL01_9BIFI|nr:MATE family efflux transporter [Bifidobacterium jacchi]KAB5607451.1 hypothetical protein EHS19_04600 [Bifidobacterium jacchi]